MIQWLSKLIFKIIGWRIGGNYPKELDKKIFIAAPHTSNWDFPLGLLARAIVNDQISYVAKSSLFKPPLGWIMKALGGVPVNRSKSTNFVRAVVDEFKKRDRLAIVIAPEGTRKRVSKFKTGFYFIAKQANIPIIMVFFKYPEKEIFFADPFYPTDDAEADIKYIEDQFRGIKGKIPANSFS